MGSLGGLCFGVAIGFAVLGLWLILPFAGLEIGLLAWALRALRSREHDYETLIIEGDAVVLEWHIGKRSGRREMNRQWVRVVCECSAPEGSCWTLPERRGAPETGRHVARQVACLCVSRCNDGRLDYLVTGTREDTEAG